MQPIGGLSLAAPSGRVQAHLVPCPGHAIAATICAVKRGFVHILWRSEDRRLQGSNGVSVIRTPSHVVSLHGFWDSSVLHVMFGGEDAKLYHASVAMDQLPVKQIPCQEVVITRATQLSSFEQRHQPQPLPIQQLMVHQRSCFAVDGSSLRVLEMNHDLTAGLLKERLPFAEDVEDCTSASMIFRERAHGSPKGVQHMSAVLFDALFQAHCQEPVGAVGLIVLASGRSLWFPLSSSGLPLQKIFPFHKSSAVFLDSKVLSWSSSRLEGLSRDTLSMACGDGQLLFFSAMQQPQRPATVLSNLLSLSCPGMVERARFFQGGLVYCGGNALWIQSLDRSCSGNVQLTALRKLPSVVPHYISPVNPEGQLLLINASGKINFYQTILGGQGAESSNQNLPDQLTDAVKQLKAVSHERASVHSALASLTPELVNLSALTAMLRTSSDPSTVRSQLRSNFRVTVSVKRFASPTVLVSTSSSAECALVVEIRCANIALLKAVVPGDLLVSCRHGEPVVIGSQRVENFCLPLREVFATDQAARSCMGTVQLPWQYAKCHACTVDVSLYLPLCQSAVPLPHADDGTTMQWEPSTVAGVTVHLARRRLLHSDACVLADDIVQAGSSTVHPRDTLSWRPLAWEPAARPFTVRLLIPVTRGDGNVGWNELAALLWRAFDQQMVSTDARELVIYSPVYGACSLRPHIQPEQSRGGVVQVLAQTASAVLLVSVRAAVGRLVHELSDHEKEELASERTKLDVDGRNSTRAPPGARYSLSLPMQQAYQWCEATLRALEADVQSVTKETLRDIWKQYKILRRLHA